MKTPLVIIGAGGLSREVLNWINHNKYSIKSFYSDNTEKGITIYGVPVVSTFKEFAGFDFVLGVGDPRAKEKLFRDAIENGLNPCRPIVHRSATRGCAVNIGYASVICPGVVITTNVKIGKGVLVNLNSTIGHDTIIEDFVTINPGSNISGNCHIKNKSFIGTGSTIREKLIVGSNSLLGMGAVLTKNLPDNETWVGNPASLIKKNSYN